MTRRQFPTHRTSAIASTASLLLLAVLVAPGSWTPFGTATATDLPTATNVCGGHALVGTADAFSQPLIGYLRLTSGTTTTCVNPGLPGIAVVTHFSTWARGTGSFSVEGHAQESSATLALPDGDSGDLCAFEVYRDSSSSVHTTLHSATTCPSFATWTVTISQAGTYRLRVRMVQTSEVVGNYNLDSDTKSGAMVAGAIRVGLSGADLTHVGYPAGSTHAYTVAGETVGVNYAHTAISTNQGTTAAAVAITDSGGAAVKTNAVSLAGSSGSTAFQVDETLPAAAASYGASLSIPNTATSTLTGVPWTHIQSAVSPTTVPSEFVALRPPFIAVDPRVTATHLLQDDNTFSTPPMSENDPDDARYSDAIGYVATRFTNARGEGLNGLTFSSNLYDTPQVIGTAEHLRTGLTTGTQGGEAGWGPLRLFNDGAPIGSWTKTVDITAPAAIDADTHLVAATKTYTINAPVGGGEGMGDPLKVFVTPLTAAPGASVRFAASEAFLDGTARTMNAADTLVYLYDPSGDLIVSGGATTEIHDGIYQHTHTLASDAEEGAWTVVVETHDPLTMDPVTTANTFLVSAGADIAASLADHRDRSLELDMHDPTTDFNGLGFDGFLIVAAWFIAFFVMLYMHKVFGAFAAFLGLFDAVTAILPGSWMLYTLLFILALWLEAIVGDKVYQKWVGMKSKNSDAP